jgi:hypothetical protein
MQRKRISERSVRYMRVKRGSEERGRVGTRTGSHQYKMGSRRVVSEETVTQHLVDFSFGGMKEELRGDSPSPLPAQERQLQDCPAGGRESLVCGETMVSGSDRWVFAYLPQ